MRPGRSHRIEGIADRDDARSNGNLVSGKPIEEPVAWYGPIVMNTDQQLQRAISELRSGTFIKER